MIPFIRFKFHFSTKLLHTLNRGVMSMNIFENIINHKINTITAEELLKYAESI